MNYIFVAQLDKDPTRDGGQDALIAAGCGGTTACINGIPVIAFSRDADTLEDALRSAKRDLNAAGFEPLRFTVEADSLPLD